MAVKLRLKRTGGHKRPQYWIVAADSRMPRDGRFLEKLGTYNPGVKPRQVTLKNDRVRYWLKKGAQPTEVVLKLLREQGLLKAAPPVPQSAGEAPAAD